MNKFTGEQIIEMLSCLGDTERRVRSMKVGTAEERKHFRSAKQVILNQISPLVEKLYRVQHQNPVTSPLLNSLLGD